MSRGSGVFFLEGSGHAPVSASDWVACKLAYEGTDPPGLQQWLAADPAHRAEFDALWTLAHDAALLEALAGFDSLANVSPRSVPACAAVSAACSRRRPWRALALAASLLPLLVLLSWSWWRPDPAPLLAVTAPGQVRVLHLDDGSVLTLNGASRVRVQLRAHRREVALDAGEVFFDVAHDAQRPFEVTLGAVQVKVLGTVFNLARDGTTSELSVYSGRVDILSGGAHQVLAQGMRIDAADVGLGMLAHFDPRGDDWREGWLQTTGIPLSRLVERLNRHSRQRIVVADPAVGVLQVSGRFRLDQPEQTLAHLTKLHALEVQRNAELITIRMAKKTAASPPNGRGQ